MFKFLFFLRRENFFYKKSVLILVMRNGFGLNTNLFETNVLNLAVVVGVVVTVVGDALSVLLKERRDTILSTLQEADEKAIEAKNRLDEAKKSVDESRVRANEIRLNAIQIAERESKEVQKQSKNDIRRLQEANQRIIQLERQQTIQIVSQQVADLAITVAENALLKTFRSNNSIRSKHKELNEKHIRETFRKLVRG
jgi:F-type H+-transporting ATPase subunit b